MSLQDETLHLDDLSDHLTLTGDEPPVWLDSWIEFTVKWHPPEPDVGIFHDTPEVKRIDYFIASHEKGFPARQFRNQALFAAAMYRDIGDDITETEAELLAVLNRLENEAIAELEKQ